MTAALMTVQVGEREPPSMVKEHVGVPDAAEWQHILPTPLGETCTDGIRRCPDTLHLLCVKGWIVEEGQRVPQREYAGSTLPFGMLRCFLDTHVLCVTHPCHSALVMQHCGSGALGRFVEAAMQDADFMESADPAEAEWH